MLRSVLAAILLLPLVGCGTFPAPLPEIEHDPRTAALRAFFGELHEKGSFHGNVIVAEGGAVLFAGSYGIADDATGRPLDRGSVLELASVGKAFTAMGICILKTTGSSRSTTRSPTTSPASPIPR